MPKAHRMKNGKWRCQVYLGDKIVDGKRKQIIKSFNANTKAEAEDLASEYRRTHGKVSAPDMTLREATDRYIAARDKTLSPSTIRAYRSYQNGVLSDILSTRLDKLDAETLQGWVNTHADTHASKTLKNASSFAIAAIRAAMPSFNAQITLPPREKRRNYIPSRDEIDALCAATTNENTRKAILLAAFCSLRRSEACALALDDIDFEKGWIHVTKARVETEDGSFITKPYTKTEDSFRDVPAPPSVLDAMKTGPITCTPNAITRSFDKTVKRAGLPHIRYHDLRHFFCSYLHAKNIPDSYIETFGGWRHGSGVMREVYRETIRKEELKQAEKIVRIFEDVSTNVSIKSEKA